MFTKRTTCVVKSGKLIFPCEVLGSANAVEETKLFKIKSSISDNMLETLIDNGIQQFLNDPSNFDLIVLDNTYNIKTGIIERRITTVLNVEKFALYLMTYLMRQLASRELIFINKLRKTNLRLLITKDREVYNQCKSRMTKK